MTGAPKVQDNIDFPAMIDDAMRGVVRTALRQVLERGLPGTHHFYISFNTNYPGVRISPQLHDRFPEEMTIVLQHQFWDLDVGERLFSVALSFNNIPEKLVIPYAAMTAFADPSIKFGLQFHHKTHGGAAQEAEASFDFPQNNAADAQAAPAADAEKADGAAEIISLDAFRKK